MSQTNAFVIGGLLDDRNLSVVVDGAEGEGNGEALRFQSGEYAWGSDDVSQGHGEAWCTPSEWSDEVEAASRVS